MNDADYYNVGGGLAWPSRDLTCSHGVLLSQSCTYETAVMLSGWKGDRGPGGKYWQPILSS